VKGRGDGGGGGGQFGAERKEGDATGKKRVESKKMLRRKNLKMKRMLSFRTKIQGTTNLEPISSGKQRVNRTQRERKPRTVPPVTPRRESNHNPNRELQGKKKVGGPRKDILRITRRGGTFRFKRRSRRIPLGGRGTDRSRKCEEITGEGGKKEKVSVTMDRINP